MLFMCRLEIKGSWIDNCDECNYKLVDMDVCVSVCKYMRVHLKALYFQKKKKNPFPVPLLLSALSQAISSGF